MFKMSLSTLVIASVFLSVSIGTAEAKSKKARQGKSDKAPVAAAAAPTPAAETPADPVGEDEAASKFDDLAADDKACQKDIATHCVGVIPGGGRVLHCLRTNKDKLGDPCKKKLYDFLKKRFESACRPDVKKLCAAESKKTGGLMPCLQAQAEKLSDPCKEMMGFKKPEPAPAAAPAADGK